MWDVLVVALIPCYRRFAENDSLGQTLKAFGKLNEKLIATYTIKILKGLDYLQRNDAVHCDLKAASILTTKNGNVKLSDFGVVDCWGAQWYVYALILSRVQYQYQIYFSKKNLQIFCA